MENKEVEQIQKLLIDNQVLTKRTNELEQQLKAKDMALDKACGKLEYDTENAEDCPSVQYGFNPKCCCEDFCDGSNKECWKEWALKELKHFG